MIKIFITKLTILGSSWKCQKTTLQVILNLGILVKDIFLMLNSRYKIGTFFYSSHKFVLVKILARIGIDIIFPIENTHVCAHTRFFKVFVSYLSMILDTFKM